MKDVKSLIAQMTLEEKAGMLSGKDFWTTKAVERLGVPSMMMTDGPHGLRKQAGASDNLGIMDSVPGNLLSLRGRPRLFLGPKRGRTRRGSAR